MSESSLDGAEPTVDDLFLRVYDELHRLAGAQRQRWHGDNTLNTTALVHEAYIKLSNQDDLSVNDRGHFFALAATAMRHILINYAAKRQAEKRGGGRPHEKLQDVNPVADAVSDELLALEEALQRLEQIDARQSRVVECRFFAGLPINETAEALGVSPATVKRDWAMASAWLYRELHQDFAP